MNRLLKLFTNENDIVLDIFAGSGTLGRSCIEMKRAYVLFDISENAKDVFEKSIDKKDNKTEED